MEFWRRTAQAGVDLATLAAILGHNSIRIVEKYVHPTAEHKQQAMRRFEESQLATEIQSLGQAGNRVN
jgi:urocanate hydratase